jgi:hypothetical protein
VTYHNSWPYFARRFRLNIIDSIEPKPGIPPAPSHLAALIAKMQTKGAGIIIVQPFEPAQIPKLLAAKANAQVVSLAPSVGSDARPSMTIRRCSSITWACSRALSNAGADQRMSDAFQFLVIALLAAIVLTGIHAYLGIHVLSRNVVFVDLALAQISALARPSPSCSVIFRKAPPHTVTRSRSRWQARCCYR